MKAIKSLLVILLISSMLVSCNQNEPDPEVMKQKALELATFLSDNYQVGDSVYFENETGEIEVFVVQVNEFIPKQISNEPNREEDFKWEIIGYRIATSLKSENSHLLVELDLNRNMYPEVYGMVRINDDWSYTGEPITIVKEDSIYINHGDKSCTLAKNVGIIHASWEEHIWTLKR